jgi:hypothetical protein
VENAKAHKKFFGKEKRESEREGGPFSSFSLSLSLSLSPSTSMPLPPSFPLSPLFLLSLSSVSLDFFHLF